MDEPGESHQFLAEPQDQDKTFDPKDRQPIPQGKVLTAKNWFLTFPQVTTTKEEALTRLKDRLKEKVLGILIAQEQHENEGECASES